MQIAILWKGQCHDILIAVFFTLTIFPRAEPNNALSIFFLSKNSLKYSQLKGDRSPMLTIPVANGERFYTEVFVILCYTLLGSSLYLPTDVLLMVQAI